MPQRAIGIVWGIAGLMAVAGLVALGLDAARSARSGPRWKRNLLAAGLVLFAALGFSSCAGKEGGSTTPTGVENPDATGLEKSPEWHVIMDAWRFVTPLAESRKSTEAQRKTMEAKVAAAGDAAKKLVRAGLLTEAEAQLLIVEAANLKAMVYRDPPTDANFTCYDMGLLPPARGSLDRLAARLPLLKQMVESATLHPSVVTTVLPAAEADLAQLGDAKLLGELRPEERKQAETVRAEAERCVKEIKALLAKPAQTSLDETPEWKNLTWAWGEAQEVGSGKRGDHPFDEAGKERLLAALAKADADLGALQAKSLVSEPEAQFLKDELARLVEGVQAKRPTEMRMATCYEPMPEPIPQMLTLDRLAVRVPLLERMAKEGQVSDKVVRMACAAVILDLWEMPKADPKRPLSDADKARLIDLRGRALKVLECLEPELLRPTCYLIREVEPRSMRDAGALAEQLALPNRAAASGALSPEAADRVRAAIAEDLRRIGGGEA